MSRACLLLAGFSLLTIACEPELGECNEAEALRIAYFFDGTANSGEPLYEGQAILARNCAGGVCHDSGVSGASRQGVPHGFDFNLDVACAFGAERECPPGSDALFENLARNRNQVYDHRRAIMGEVERGTMPPQGYRPQDDPEAPVEYFRGNAPANFDPLTGGDTPLPEIDTAEGQDILRNWLACGAPVIGAHRLPVENEPGQTCAVPVDEGVACVVRHEPPPPPDATWDSIYEFFSGGTCVTRCHDGNPEGLFADSMLDLSDQDVAYMELTGPAFVDGVCSGQGPLIVPSDPAASLLVQKLQGGDGLCGESMPQGRQPLPPEYVQPIVDWIMAGAPAM